AFELLVRICCRHARAVVLASILAAMGAGFYVSKNFEMDSNAEDLISAEVPWRQYQAEFDRAFPQRNNLTVVVIDGVTPERTQQAAAALEKALAGQPKQFPIVRDIQGDAFFAKNGLLFLPAEDVRKATQQIIGAQPFLAPLAADPSMRGIMDSLSTALLGVENGQGDLEQLSPALTALSETLEKTVSGHPAFLSWQKLITGQAPGLRETRRIIEVQAVLDYTKLAPGAASNDLIRRLAADLHLNPDEGVSVRLTGPVPLADEEFATLVDRAGLMAGLMMSAILLTLWVAVRSVKIIAAILLTLFAGLAITTALAIAALGTFNVISVAFIPLFVGIGVDFGIQYTVRYRAERHASGDLEEALARAGKSMGPSLALAALATAACFFSLVPTDYSGLAELGLIAGSGMIIAFFLSGTMLPALLKLMKPKGEQTEVGIARFALVDAFLYRHRRGILISAGVAATIGLALLPLLKFDANPLHLRSPRTESMATVLDLAKDPDTSPNTIDVLAPSRAEADALARRLSALSEVDKTLTLASFIPDDQPEKLALISDAAQLMDTTLNPFEVKPPPSKAETMASIAATKNALRKAAGGASTPGAQAALRLSLLLERLETAGDATLERTTAALVPGLVTVLDQLRFALSAQPVDLAALPRDLQREWVSTNGRNRVQVFARGDSNDDATLENFTNAVRTVAPEATGTPISTQESGRTIVNAFIGAGALSFLAMVVLLAIFLRNLRDVILTLIPLLLIVLLTCATCVVLNLPLNFANIIVLPLLLGVGVAFNIYFVVAWRAGGHNFLQSSLARAVILSAATTATGFGTLWLSNHPGTASMGELLMISLAWTLITTLFFVPPLLESASSR
ncbi:MAG TPA: MMPL family transporter, partial [Micropepsaceae bacterium]|nr:MMPL family transporter [Micropepsaceae bacterium]